MLTASIPCNVCHAGSRRASGSDRRRVRAERSRVMRRCMQLQRTDPLSSQGRSCSECQFTHTILGIVAHTGAAPRRSPICNRTDRRIRSATEPKLKLAVDSRNRVLQEIARHQPRPGPGPRPRRAAAAMIADSASRASRDGFPTVDAIEASIANRIAGRTTRERRHNARHHRSAH